MKKNELIEAVIHRHHQKRQSCLLSKADTEAVLESLGEVVALELKGGGDVTLPGIGKLAAQLRKARTGRNPKTGEELLIGEKRTPKFTAAKALKLAIAHE